MAIVGDIHGAIGPLRGAVNFLRGHPDRLTVFVGDYIDRGRASRDVIDELCGLSKRQPSTVFLRGNHEVALLDFLETGSSADFLAQGGLATVKSYFGDSIPPNAFAEFRRRFPAAHTEFLTRTVTYFENSDVLVSHMGLNPLRPHSRDIDDMCVVPSPQQFTESSNDIDKVIVSGHYAQASGVPHLSEKFICVDTGCGTVKNAPLSVLLLPERKIEPFRGDV